MNGGIKMQETRLSVEQRREALKSAYPKWEKKTIAAHFKEQCRHYRYDAGRYCDIRRDLGKVTTLCQSNDSAGCTAG